MKSGWFSNLVQLLSELVLAVLALLVHQTAQFSKVSFTIYRIEFCADTSRSVGKPHISILPTRNVNCTFGSGGCDVSL